MFESTVDPGTTENRCIPLMEQISELTEGEDFFVGYSPERVSPGDQCRRVGDIAKIFAGSTPTVTTFMEQLYSRVVKAGLFKAASIKVAEAAKVLENTQRDVNIALINEMMQLFDAMDIKVSDVVEAAGSNGTSTNISPVWSADIVSRLTRFICSMQVANTGFPWTW